MRLLLTVIMILAVQTVQAHENIISLKCTYYQMAEVPPGTFNFQGDTIDFTPGGDEVQKEIIITIIIDESGQTAKVVWDDAFGSLGGKSHWIYSHKITVDAGIYSYHFDRINGEMLRTITLDQGEYESRARCHKLKKMF